MPKPKWLKEIEREKTRVKPPVICCGTCRNFGRFVKYTKYMGKETVEVHECDVHPGCFNTKYSIRCDDYLK